MNGAPDVKLFETVAELSRKENNPRNSEGDFLRLKNGNILFAYSRYTGNSSHDDAACDVCALISADNGKSFTALDKPLVRASEYYVRNIMSVSLVRLIGGDAVLVYLVKLRGESYIAARRFIDEDSLTLGRTEILLEKKDGTYYVINNARLTTDRDGFVYLPVAEHAIKEKGGSRGGVYYGRSSVYRFTPDLRSKTRVVSRMDLPFSDRPFSETGLQEPGVVIFPDRIFAYFRTDRGAHYFSESSDGTNFGRARRTAFTAPDSPMLIRRDPFGGMYYAFWNPIPKFKGRLTREERWVSGGRTPFVFAVSRDGRDWSKYAELENDPYKGYCYPAVFFLGANDFLLSYCAGGPEDGNCLTKTKIVHVATEL